jgi:hypothetical protein
MSHPGWGPGDLFSIFTGLVVLLFCLYWQPRHRTVPAATVILASGMSLGPLLLIALDPITESLGITGSLLDVVLNEGRATLWRASIVTALCVVRDLI